MSRIDQIRNQVMRRTLTVYDRLLARPLTSSLLRRIALPLRNVSPALYARLNGVRRGIMSHGGALAAHQVVAVTSFRKWANLEGARVLEIGSDPKLNVAHALIESGASEVIGINNDSAIWQTHRTGRILASGNVTLLPGDASALPFRSGSFDQVFSISVFEHVLELEKALGEMHRVLQPGGLVYAHFGPIWSSCKGHHVRVEVDGERAMHFEPLTNPLPDYCHLVLGRVELRDALRARVSPRLVEPIVSWVYDDPGINRLFYHEYLGIFERSPLQVLSVEPERDPVSPQLRRILEFRYPPERAFDVTNLEAVLRKTD